jgi:hypothetical protein
VGAIFAIGIALKKSDVTIALPQQDVHLDLDPALAAATLSGRTGVIERCASVDQTTSA